MTSINLLKVAAMPGSGSGCQSALPAEVGIRGFGRVEVCPAGQPAPWAATHESWDYCGPDGQMYQAKGLEKPPADLLDAAGGGE